MAKITYNGESEQVSWRGVAFARGEAVSVEDQDLIRAAGRHPLFEVAGVKADGDTPQARGEAAAVSGKPRTVPPAYRGKSEAEQWLQGYDSASEAE